MSDQIKKAKIFLFYARRDKAEVIELYTKLSSAGFKPWMDVRDILPAENWRRSLKQALADSDFSLHVYQNAQSTKEE